MFLFFTYYTSGKMGLSSKPFHPVTNGLLPGYRDAYLRGDLSRTNTELVDTYLLAHADEGDETLRRFHKLKASGHQVQPVGWVAQQFHLLRTEPVRFRRRASGLVLVGVFLSGLVFAGNRESAEPSLNSPAVPTLGAIYGEGAGLSAAAMTTTLHGHVLDENGNPLVGATVLDKESGRGVSTNADGSYALQVPIDHTARLQYGYGGYHEEEVTGQGQRVQNVTLLPDADKKSLRHKKHWWN